MDALRDLEVCLHLTLRKFLSCSPAFRFWNPKSSTTFLRGCSHIRLQMFTREQSPRAMQLSRMLLRERGSSFPQFNVTSRSASPCSHSMVSRTASEKIV